MPPAAEVQSFNHGTPGKSPPVAALILKQPGAAAPNLGPQLPLLQARHQSSGPRGWLAVVIVL